MKRKLLITLFCLCLIFMTSCGKNKTVSNDTDNVTLTSQAEETPDSKDTTENKNITGNEPAKETDFKELTEAVSTDSNEDKSNATTSEDAENKDVSANEKLVDGMRPEFKEAMDSYEAFYDEYCDIMKKYTENPSDMELLTSYADMLTKAAEMSEKFEVWEDNEMNDTELKYYLDVNNRITKKLIDVSK